MILEKIGIHGWKQQDENLVMASLLTGDPLLLIGNHGCAKTHIANKIAEALGKKFVVYDASKAMFEDVLGYPNIDLVIDSDGHVRRSLLFDPRIHDPKNPDEIAPSMDVVTLASFLDKPLSEYKKTTPPHVKAARQLDNLESTKIEYVITEEGPEPVQKIKHKIDYEHYIKKQLKPIADSILHFFDRKFEDIVKGSKQSSLGSFA